MFTGIVEEVASVEALEVHGGGGRLRLCAPLCASDAVLGASIAVNGVCLTITERDGTRLEFDLAAETLRRSNLGQLACGAGVHVERALLATGRFGGHVVQGHVDSLGQLAERRPDGASLLLRIEASPELLRWVVPKGFIAVDGVSLTVIDLLDAGFTLTLVPHTQQLSTLAQKPLGAPVNLEGDIFAKYAEKWLRRTR